MPLIIVPPVVGFFYKVFGDPYEKWGSWRNGLAGLAFILLNHYQIISMLSHVHMQLPRRLSVNYGIWASSSDISNMFNVDCAGYDTGRLLMLKTGFPAWYLVLSLGTVLGSRVLSRMVENWRGIFMETNRAFNAAISLMLTFFFGMVGLSFTLFVCKTNPNGTSSLGVDRSITCFEDEWFNLIIIGIVGVILWCVGVSALFSWAIFTMVARMHEPHIQMRWKFLFIKFRADRYFR